MIRRLALILALLLPAAVRANYVSSNVANYATATSTTCSLTSVTIGHMIIFGVQANSTTSVTYSSTVASSATLVGPETQAGGTVFTYYWYGPATATSGNLVATFSAGSALIGSVCEEVTSTTFDASGHTSGSGTLSINITTSHNSEDLVGFGTTGVSTSPILITPYTQRQQATSSGTPFAAIGDRQVVAAGAYVFSPSTNGSSTAFVGAFYSAATSVPVHSQIVKEIPHAPSPAPVVIVARAALRGPRPDYRIRDGR